MTRPVSCGVLVTDGRRLILGHATRTTRWDIPKGLANPGEPHRIAARRELQEETGLTAAADMLIDLGLHQYLPAKDLALFLWQPGTMPDPAAMHCTSMVGAGRAAFPEFDRFAAPDWNAAMQMLGASMRRVLSAIAVDRGWPATTLS